MWVYVAIWALSIAYIAKSLIPTSRRTRREAEQVTEQVVQWVTETEAERKRWQAKCATSDRGHDWQMVYPPVCHPPRRICARCGVLYGTVDWTYGEPYVPPKEDA